MYSTCIIRKLVKHVINNELTDPALMTQDISEDQFKLYQEAEFKHGRIAMLAFVGIFAAEVLHPLLFREATVISAVDQIQSLNANFPQFWLVAFGMIGVLEGLSIFKAWQSLDETMQEPYGLAKLKKSHIPGDLSFDPMHFKPPNLMALQNLKLKELNNGRLAM